MKDETLLYEPLNVLKPVCPDVWIVDGPIVHFGIFWLRFPFPTRMTIVRLAGNALFIHSPTALCDELRAAVGEIGTPHWIVAPNRLHHTWIGAWQEAYPQALPYLTPKLVGQSPGKTARAFQVINADHGYPWDDAMDTIPVTGRYMTEIDFFHRPSRSLILTDLIENFEGSRVKTLSHRLLMRLGGVLDPHGGMPKDMRLTFDRRRLRLAIEAMIERHPERIILSHGRWYPGHGEAELKRAFSWLLKEA